MATESVLRPGELKDILLKEIASADLATVDTNEVGTVLEVRDGVARIYGLNKALAGEMLEFTSHETGETVIGLVLNLEEDSVGAAIMGDYLKLKEGDEVRCTGRVLDVPVGPAMLGRVVDALGRPVDGRGPIQASGTRLVEMVAPGIIVRQPVKEPLQTGIKAIDAMIPIGRGQRELIIGDRGTGKTAIAVDTIINQKGTGVICVYVAIGQKRSTVASVVETAPRGRRDGVHHRRRRLRLRPGAAAVHRALRRLRDGRILHVRGGSGHALRVRRPLQAGRRVPPDVAAPPPPAGPRGVSGRRLLPPQPPARARRQDLREMRRRVADGPADHRDPGRRRVGLHSDQRHLDHGRADLPRRRTCSTPASAPPWTSGISVSRVGGNAQIKAMKQVAGPLRGSSLAQYRELEAFAQFGSDLDAATQKQLARGARLVEVLKQPQYAPMAVERQVAIIYVVTNGYLDDVDVRHIRKWEQDFLDYLDAAHPAVLDGIRTKKAFDKDMTAALEAAITAFKPLFRAA